MNSNVTGIIKAALWGETPPHEITIDDYNELYKHAILCLAIDILQTANVPKQIQATWKKHIYQQLAYYAVYSHEEENIPLTIPYVILKGSSAGKYYPHKEYRTYGDIDIMTRRQDYQLACQCLLDHGYRELPEDEGQHGRHRAFVKNGVEVEVHFFFSSLTDLKKAEALDNMIVQCIPSDSHQLPDYINGLVILEHVAQHLQKGIGLRQIIDWMMFVDKCISDDNWSDFQHIVQVTGLTKLAKVTTRVCEEFLGLSNHTWSATANKKLCNRYFQYILSCGNFGRKNTPQVQSVREHIKSGHLYTALKTIVLRYRIKLFIYELGIKKNRKKDVWYNGSKWEIAKR